MLLVIDVGNTNIVFGVFRDDELLNYWRTRTDMSRTADELGMFIRQMLEYDGFGIEDIKDVIVSSVVPTIMYSLNHMIQKYIDLEPIVVGPGIKTGLNIKYDNPKQVGTDRIVNAVGALRKYGGPLIIIDFGTATTFCAVTENSEYLGGAISPGIKISSEALYQAAAKLTRVELVKPRKAIGTTTTESMQSGIVFGYVGLVDDIVNRFKEEMGSDDIKVIATGGLSSLIATESKTIGIIDKLITLEGLNYIYKLNKR